MISTIVYFFDKIHLFYLSKPNFGFSSQEAKASIIYAQEKEAEVRVLESTVSELESTVDVLENKVPTRGLPFFG